jgi:glycosyltransferase involved in cell wall biosynthesis
MLNPNNLDPPVDFTIITPNLNYGRFLGECLESVASQRGVSLEHLVYDAGSTDNSALIAAKFPNIVWIQEPDRGMSDAINKGFARAHGDWVMWLNADDRLNTGSLSRILPILRNCNDDVVYGDWDFVDESGNFLRHVRSARWSTFVHVHHHCYVGSTAAFHRRNTIIGNNLRLHTDFHYVMDGEFYARLHRLGKKFRYVPGAIAAFRLHDSNISQKYLTKCDSMDMILEAEHQHAESRAIRRVYGITLFNEPYLNGLTDGILWILAKGWKQILKLLR